MMLKRILSLALPALLIAAGLAAYLCMGRREARHPFCEELEVETCLRINHLLLQEAERPADLLPVDLLFEQVVCGAAQSCPPQEESLPRIIDVQLAYDHARLSLVKASPGGGAVAANKEMKTRHRPEDGRLRLLFINPGNVNRVGPGVLARLEFRVTRESAGDGPLVELLADRTSMAPPEARKQLRLSGLD